MPSLPFIRVQPSISARIAITAHEPDDASATLQVAKAPARGGTAAERGARTAVLPLPHALLLLVLWLVIFVASLWTPPLLDDADATHAQAAQSMARTGDWVTLHVDGVRYLEKPPLPYWLAALSLRLFGNNSFAVHLPLALAVLGLAWLAYVWGKRSFGERAALYAAMSVLTATGVFLFTRVFIPEALLSFLLGVALYCVFRSLEMQTYRPSAFAYTVWAMMALAVLTKGLIAVVFLVGATAIYLGTTGEWRQWRRLRPLSGVLLFLALAAPWHVLAGMRNTGGANGHGFLWFYFVNEHFLRFLGQRIPHDYNKLPVTLYWSLHIIWLFPWSLFAPVAFIEAWRRRRALLHPTNERQRTALLLVIFSTLLLVFFSLSTNQEYYTFPAYMPLLLLITAALVRAEQAHASDPVLRRCMTFAHAAYTIIGLGAAIALAYGLWNSRHMPFVPDIGDLLERRGVGNYTLSMSHFFDLTTASFAALRAPAALAAIALSLGPIAAWMLRAKRRDLASTVTIALTSTMFLLAAHIALVRFSSMLSSQDFVERIHDLEADHSIPPNTQVLLFGDQAYGSSIPFYLQRRVDLVDARSTSMLFGSTFPDAPAIFWTSAQLSAQWGRGPRKLLLVPEEKRDEVDKLLGTKQVVLEETSGKALVTDRPLDGPSTPCLRIDM